MKVSTFSKGLSQTGTWNAEYIDFRNTLFFITEVHWQFKKGMVNLKSNCFSVIPLAIFVIAFIFVIFCCPKNWFFYMKFSLSSM